MTVASDSVWRWMIRSGMRRLQETLLPLYERTRQFHIYEPGVIPGLFQTAGYAQARMGRIIEFNGSTGMMAAQLAHLWRATTLPAVGLGIIPAGAARTMWFSPGFWIYAECRVLIEAPAAELAITQPRQIAVDLRTFAELAAMAVYGSQARDLISRANSGFS